jgi:AraC-like DNA-binding protein
MDKIMKPGSGTLRKKEGFEGQRACILTHAKRMFCAKHSFCQRLYITDIGFYPKAAFHNRERKNGCAQYILIYCVSGKGWYSLNNKTYTVTGNQFFIIPAGASHKYGADITNPWSIYWVHFTGETAEFYYKLLTTSKKPAPVIAIANATRLMLFDDIVQHLELMNNNDNIVYSNSCLYAFLSSFQVSEMRISINENDLIQQCISYMKKNLDKTLRLDELSRAVNLSSSHLSAIFRNRMKYSPIHLFTSFKMQKACQLLMDGHLNIKTIAHSLGYDDQYHFSRVFKNTMGVSPKKFKKE